jgi:type I restriction enzyme S subunit
MEEIAEKVGFDKYAAYKDSGVDWLGEVPEHWEVSKGKWLFSKQDRPVSKTDEIITCFRDGQVTLRSNRKLDGFTNALKEHGYQGIRKGDLVIHNMDAFAGAIGVSDSNGKSTPVYSVCIPRKPNTVNPTYYAFLLRNLAKNGLIESLAKGIRERSTDFRFNDFGALLLYFPPLDEQNHIVEFIQIAFQKIDSVIAQKEKQIELLKERRQVLIHKAVTQGLNPDVPMKDSGVEWIGEIPKHWEVKKLRYLANCFPSNVDKHSKPNEKEIRLCNYTDVYKNDYITNDMELMVATASKDQINKFTLKKDDIVITKDSETANDIAVPTYIKELLTNVVCGYHLAIIRSYQRTYCRYLFQSLKTKIFNVQFEVCSNGITRVGLGTSDLKNGSFLLPPEQEQIEIADFIEQASAKIDTAINSKQKEIEKLKEYKATLINSVGIGFIVIVPGNYVSGFCGGCRHVIQIITRYSA